MSKEKREWYVDDEDRRIAFLHDCRVYNGGLVATAEEQAKWSEKATEPVTDSGKNIIFIDRLSGS